MITYRFGPGKELVELLEKESNFRRDDTIQEYSCIKLFHHVIDIKLRNYTYLFINFDAAKSINTIFKIKRCGDNF